MLDKKGEVRPYTGIIYNIIEAPQVEKSDLSIVDYVNFMEDADIANSTNGLVPQAHLQYYPKSPFPAWVPAATVAVSMLVFLAASFYLRHRKVVKKRQLLMDYFYIIFQYGGTRRKRMVTALCNTNSIALKDLGRSFMISCDSSTNNDTNYPYYLEDQPFSKPHGTQRRPLLKKHSFFKNRGMTITKKYRGPFLRFKTLSEDHPRQYQSSFQDIVMKFRARRAHGDTAQEQPMLNRHTLLAPQFEGCSMCTIHDDEVNFDRFVEENEVPAYSNRQRRNAHIIQYEKNIPKFADVVKEVTRNSLAHVGLERVRSQQSHCSGKRNSEPWEHLQDKRVDHSLSQDHQTGVFHVHDGRLSPSNVGCGSQGYIRNDGERSNSIHSYRNSEPTILIHSPSTETVSSQGWSDIGSRCTNGVVFLKRVPKTDGTPGEFYYEEKVTPQLDRAARASLSKVSYVPSGNMNEYYNCIPSPNKENSNMEGTLEDTKEKSAVPGSSKCKRGKLSLDNFAVNNFNRRIDMASESLHEYDPDQSLEKSSSRDSTQKQQKLSSKPTSRDSIPQQRLSSKTTWKRLKNVFSGSRAVQNLQTEATETKYVPVTGLHKNISIREGTRWQRFISAITSFNSLPETKKLDDAVDVPITSNSFPLSLNILSSSFDDSSGKTDTEKNIFNETVPVWATESKDEVTMPTITCSSDNKFDSFKRENNTDNQRYQKRPTTLLLKSKMQSFPDELTHEQHYFKRFKTTFDANRIGSPKTFQTSRSGSNFNSKLNNYFVPSSISWPESKKDFRSYSFEAGYSSSPGEYKFKQCPQFMENKAPAATLDKMEENDNDSETKFIANSSRNLSPLPEINITDSNKSVQNPVISNVEPLMDQSIYMTPVGTESNNLPDFESEMESSGQILNSIKWLQKPDSLDSHLGVSNDKHCFPVNTENSQEVNTEEEKYMDSRFVKQNALCSIKYSTHLQSNSIMCSEDISPQFRYLTPEHRDVSRSTDSVYYDTVSAQGTPSPCELRDILHFTGSPLHSDCSLKLEDMECIHSRDCREKNITSNNCSFNIIIDTLNQHAVPLSNTSIIDSENVPCSQDSRTMSHSETKTSLPFEQTCNNFTNIISVSTKSEEHLDTTEITSSGNNSNSVSVDQISTNEKIVNRTSPIDAENTFQNLHKSALKLCSSEYLNTSNESSPKSSRSPTPTRRHSTPSPSPDRSLSRSNGYYSPDEMYRANVARLPRLSQRTSCHTSMSNCALQNVLISYDDKNENATKSLSEHTTYTSEHTTTGICAGATSTVEDYVVKISPYETIM